jgi:hypothetical protein
MCLFLVWITFQCGMLVRSTTPNVTTGNAFLIAVSVANIVILLSPVFLALIAVCGLVPEHVRRRVSTLFIRSDSAPAHTSDSSNETEDSEKPQKEQSSNLSSPPQISSSTAVPEPDVVPFTIEMTSAEFVPRGRGSSNWGSGRDRGSSQFAMFEPTFFSNSTEDVGDVDPDPQADESHVKK